MNVLVESLSPLYVFVFRMALCAKPIPLLSSTRKGVRLGGFFVQKDVK